MLTIPLEQLESHSDNANRMSEEFAKKLEMHIGESGRYPPLIVRPHPELADRYQILDGHHRAEILKRLGHESANCDVWNVDDEQAAILLLTLNRLHGEDDPLKRGTLLENLRQTLSSDEIVRMLPDTAVRIERLMQLTHAPPAPAKPHSLDDMPQAVTFFLTPSQRFRLTQRLDEICPNRSEALIRLLDLESTAL